MTIAAILADKAKTSDQPIISIGPDMPVSEVLSVLAKHRIGAVLVLKGDDIAGILSERDIVRALEKDGAAVLTKAARNLMTPNPTTVDHSETSARAMAIMTDGRFRHLPVVNDGKLVGLVSIGDVVRKRIEDAEREAEEVKAYVAAGGA